MRARMKCRRAFATDLAAVLRGEEADDRTFAAHVTTCADCAAEVGVWKELDAMLRAGAPTDATHPEPEALLALVDAPAALAAGARTAVERHIAACRVCADEVKSLRACDPRMVDAEGPAHADDGPTAMRGRLARLVWHPAFAYALVAVLLVPLVRRQLGHRSEPARVVDARRGVCLL
jgi:anti-sigma factor RsiW